MSEVKGYSSVTRCLAACKNDLSSLSTERANSGIAQSEIQRGKKELVRGCEIFRHTYRDIARK